MLGIEAERRFDTCVVPSTTSGIGFLVSVGGRLECALDGSYWEEDWFGGGGRRQFSFSYSPHEAFGGQSFLSFVV